MITAVLLGVAIVLIIVKITWKWNGKVLPPGPFAWPVIGNAHVLRQLSREYGGQHFALNELSRQYDSGVIKLRMGPNDLVIVSDKEGVHKVLNSSDYDGRPWNEFIELRNMGQKKGITMNDGPEWKEIRAWTIRALRSLGFGRKDMLEMLKDELVQILDNFKDGGVFRLKPYITPAVINVLWTMLTGKRLSEETRLQYFLELLERRSKAFDMVGGILSTLPWLRYIMPEATGYNLLVTLNNELKDFLVETINDHKSQYIEGDKSDLINMFLYEMYSGKGPAAGFTEQQLLLILVDIFIAGTNTTAATLDLVFLNITVHDDVQRRLHKEIDSVVGSERLPSLNDRPEMPYTEAILTESQRVFLVTPILGPRRVLSETKLGGYTLPKGMTVLINTFNVNMDPKLYPEPYKFNPDRFIKNNVYESDDNIILFGKGRRRCPGEVLSRAALFLLFTGIMQKFEILPAPGKEYPSLVLQPGLTLSSKPYEVLLVPRRKVSSDKIYDLN